MDHIDKVRIALDSSTPFESLVALATKLRDSGLRQRELTALLDHHRALHQQDSDETKYNAILDVMDLVTGWCSPGKALNPTDGAAP